MPIKGTYEVWKKNRLTTGFQCPLTKEFFPTQSDLDSRVCEYNSCIWKSRHNLEGKPTTWSNANSAEMKALNIIKDKFHSTLTHLIVNKAHQSVLSLEELSAMISKNCESLIKGEEVKMENGNDIILSCKVVKVHSEDSSYTINDGTRDILRVPATYLKRPHELTLFDIESLIRLTCTQSAKDQSWQVDEGYQKEFGMKQKLAPIFCKPSNGSKKEATSSEDDVVIFPPAKKAKRESNDSLKENGDKKEDKKEKKPRKRKEDNGEKEKTEKKKPKKEPKQEVINLDSTDDETPLSVLAEKLKDKKQKQGFLDKFLTASPSSSKGSPSKKKRKGKVQKAIEPLVALYEKEDCSSTFIHECDTLAKVLTKEIMDTAIQNIRNMEDGEKNIEVEILLILQWRKQLHSLSANVQKLPKEERVVARETNKKELDMMEGKILFEKTREKMKAAKTIKEIEEDERGDYDKSMGILSPPGVNLSSPHFPIALMISEFIYTRSNLFPSNYRLPMTEEIDDALSAQGKEKDIKSKKVTYPIVKILMEMLMKDARFQKHVFCNSSIAKLKLDEYSIVEMIRVILTGEKPATKEERQKWINEEKEVHEKKDEEVEERPNSPDGTENDEDERDGDITMNEDDRLELVGALDGCDGRWERIDGKSQGSIIEFLLNCYIDSDLFEIKKDLELQEENDDLKREKRELTKKMDETRVELKELQNNLQKKESCGLRLARSETGKILELEEILSKNETKLDGISTLMKNLEKELDLSKYGSRLDPIGIDRHGRRYMMMPNYAGLVIQSFGSEEWIKDEDGTEYFGFIPSKEEWRRIMTVTEWDELCVKLRNGSRRDIKLAKAMDKNKDKFEYGIEWSKKVEENKVFNENDDEAIVEELTEMEVLRSEMRSLIEKSENGELLKVKDISLLNKKMNEADSIDEWRSLLIEFEEKIKTRANEEHYAINRLIRFMDETFLPHSVIGWRKRAEGARLSELLMLMRVLDYRVVWNYKEIAREKEDKKKNIEDKKKKEEEDEEDNEWANKRVIHTRGSSNRAVESKDKHEVRDLMKKVISLASGRLISTLNTLESDDERLMNMKDIEDECHRYSLDKLKKVLRNNVHRWRSEIESRFIHRLDQFDEFAEALDELL